MTNENRNVDNALAMEHSNIKDEKFEVDDSYNENCFVSAESGCDNSVYKDENGNLNESSSNLRLNTMPDLLDILSSNTDNGADSSSCSYRELETITHTKLEKTESNEDVVLSEVYFNNYMQSEDNDYSSSVENITTFTEIKLDKDIQQYEATSLDVPSGSDKNNIGENTEKETSDQHLVNDRQSVSCEIYDQPPLVGIGKEDSYKPEGEKTLDSLRTSKRKKIKSRREEKSTNMSGRVCSSLKSGTKCQPRRKIYGCKICDKKFRWPFALERHISVHTIGKPFECEICRTRYCRKDHLDDHMKIHTYGKPYECEMCHYKAARKSDLKTHMVSHKGEKMFQCEICGNSFSRKCRLVEHMRIHSGRKEFKCGICQHKFLHKGHLGEHMKYHIGEKPYECDICQHKSYRKYDLEVHIRRHYREKPFKCSICDNKYFRNYALKLHIMSKHTGEKPYKCEICEFRTHDNRKLKIHKMSHTGVGPYQCDICEYTAIRKWSLQQHLKVHVGYKHF